MPTGTPARTRTNPTIKAYGRLSRPDGQQVTNVQVRWWESDGFLILLGTASKHQGEATGDPKVVSLGSMTLAGRPARAGRTSGPWTWTDEDGGVWSLAPGCGCSLPGALQRYRV